MKLFKNGVGRPSNETKQLRQVFIVSVAAIVVSVVALLISLITNTNINGGLLKGKALGNYSGDVNGDGKLNNTDAQLILEYSAKIKKATATQIKAGDVDKNGKLTASDARTVLVNLPAGSILGDVNKNRKVNVTDANLILKYSANTLSSSEKKKFTCKSCADMNGDGKVTAADARLAYIKANDGDYETYQYQLGDVNKDKKITKEDAELILKYSAKTAKFDDVQKSLADLNGDGKIEAADARIALRKAVVPGDVNGDGKVTKADAELVLNSSAKLSSVDSKLGDMNQDGKLTAADARLILKIADKEVKATVYGDVNQDGKVTYDDAVYVLKNVNNLNKNKSNIKFELSDMDGNRKIEAADARAILLKSDYATAKGKDLKGYKPGDVNKNGRITDSDAELVLQFAAELKTPTSEQKLLADMNGDGKITSADARWILNLAQTK